MFRAPTAAITLHRAARLAALIDVDDLGLLRGHTCQEIADALGGVPRSTALKAMR